MDQPDLPWDGKAAETESTASRAPGTGALRHLFDENFLQYASYVIRDRAIPDMEDGLKPVQRRILYSLHETDDGKFTKVANIVGHTMQYHPHGDASIADALVALVNRGYLVEGQGNFGNPLTGDPAAASRYIECRLTPLARDEVFNKELTSFVKNYDGRRREPVHLPSKMPLLLMLGAEGIAVGLSTRIFPHNLKELLEAQVAILKKERFQLVPDFQQGGLMDPAEYAAGNGRLRLRAVVETRDPRTLVIREIPYGTTTESVMASIEDAVRKKKLTISSVEDYTASAVEIEIKLPDGQTAERVIQKLYAFTLCEVAFTGRVVVIHKNRPVETDVHEVLRINTRRLVNLLKRELEWKRRTLLDEIHRKTLVQIFVEKRLYKRIEECKTLETVQEAVLKGLHPFRKQLNREVTLKDVEMLLGIPIKRISRFDMEKSRRDVESMLLELEGVEKNLADLTGYAVRYLRGLIRKYTPGLSRRTRITSFEEIEVRSLTAGDLTIAHNGKKGYLGHAVKGDDLYTCSPHDRLLVVWKDGRYRVMPPPEKLFVDDQLLYTAIFDRNKVFTLVYTEDGVTYMKRFKFGGAILNKEYTCALPGAKVLLFTDTQPEAIYVKYKKQKRQRINQQRFVTSRLEVRTAKSKGAQMTVKPVQSLNTRKPRGWDKTGQGPAGSFIDFA